MKGVEVLGFDERVQFVAGIVAGLAAGFLYTKSLSMLTKSPIGKVTLFDDPKLVKQGITNVDEVSELTKLDVELTAGYQGGTGVLNEDVFTRYMPDGSKVTDFSHLPGNTGIEVPERLSVGEMTYLTQEYGVEFAQVYQRGGGINGGGGKYFIYSGDVSSVKIPINKDVIIINHTHPGGTAYPSLADKKLLSLLEQVGSPQKISEIIPIGNLETIKFGVDGIK